MHHKSGGLIGEDWMADHPQLNATSSVAVGIYTCSCVHMHVYIYISLTNNDIFFPAVLCADQSGRTQCRALAQSRNQESLLKKIYSWQLHTHNYHRYVRQNYDIREVVFRLIFFHSQLLKQNVVRKTLVSWGRRCYF